MSLLVIFVLCGLFSSSLAACQSGTPAPSWGKVSLENSPSTGVPVGFNSPIAAVFSSSVALSAIVIAITTSSSSLVTTATTKILLNVPQNGGQVWLFNLKANAAGNYMLNFAINYPYGGSTHSYTVSLPYETAGAYCPPVTTGLLTTGPLTTGLLTTGPLTTGLITSGALTTRSVTTQRLTSSAVTSGNPTTQATGGGTPDITVQPLSFLAQSGQVTLFNFQIVNTGFTVINDVSYNVTANDAAFAVSTTSPRVTIGTITMGSSRFGNFSVYFSSYNSLNTGVTFNIWYHKTTVTYWFNHTVSIPLSFIGNPLERETINLSASVLDAVPFQALVVGLLVVVLAAGVAGVAIARRRRTTHVCEM